MDNFQEIALLLPFQSLHHVLDIAPSIWDGMLHSLILNFFSNLIIVIMHFLKFFSKLSSYLY